MDKEKRKEFFNYVDKNYKAKNEDVQEDVRDMKNYKDRDRKGHEAYMFIHVIKGNSSNKFNDDFGFTKAEMDQMDKLISKIKKMHVASFDGGSSAPASLEFYGDEASLTKFLADRNVQKIVKKYKAKYGIAVGSGTDALTIAIKSLNIKFGDEIITAANTAIPTITAIINAGARPKLIDIGEDYLIDISKIEKEITSKTR